MFNQESNNFEETEDNSRNNEFNKRLSEYNISDDDKEVNIAEDTFYIKSLPSQQRSAIFKILDEASKNLIDSSSNNNKGTNDKESSMNNTPSKLSKNFEKEEIKSLSSKCNNNNNNEIESSSYLKQSTSESITFDEETNKNSSINDNNSEIANNSVEYLSRVERESILRKALLNGTLLEKYEEIAAGSTCRLKSNTTSSIDPVKPIMERLKKLNDLKKKHCYIEDSSGNESKSRPQYKTKKKVVVKPYGVSTGKNKSNTKSILSKSILAKHFMKYVDDIKD
ncbi:hypothetical protein O3M35_009319 [Rhynocoris fuscipes]|uniref:Uncharacterized protein n=1 Tax=Rhynocoris fuscipes TaxID=488301 RepID=A0AAW1D3T1_9HEMI